MTVRDIHYDAECYDFPDDELPPLSSNELHAEIEKCRFLALDMVDGTLEGPTPVQIDYAQDRIQQCRDLLLDRGVEFDQAFRDGLPFLRWPKTPEELEEEEVVRQRERSETAELRAAASIVSSRMRLVVKAAFDGLLELDSTAAHGIKLKLGRGSKCTGDPEGPTGAEVLSLVEDLQALGESSAEVWKPYEGFAFDPGPFWSFSVDLPTKPKSWEVLVSWYAQHSHIGMPTFEYSWEYKSRPMSSWDYLHGILPKQNELNLLDQLLGVRKQTERVAEDAIGAADGYASQAPQAAKLGGLITRQFRLKRSVKIALVLVAAAAGLHSVLLPESLPLKGIGFGAACFCVGVLLAEHAAIWARAPLDQQSDEAGDARNA